MEPKYCSDYVSLCKFLGAEFKMAEKSVRETLDEVHIPLSERKDLFVSGLNRDLQKMVRVLVSGEITLEKTLEIAKAQEIELGKITASIRTKNEISNSNKEIKNEKKVPSGKCKKCSSNTFFGRDLCSNCFNKSKKENNSIASSETKNNSKLKSENNFKTCEKCKLNLTPIDKNFCNYCSMKEEKNNTKKEKKSNFSEEKLNFAISRVKFVKIDNSSTNQLLWDDDKCQTVQLNNGY